MARPGTVPLYLDDLEVGRHFKSEKAEVTTAAIKAFASQFDPQPFHLDEVAASASLLRGLAASGWHTAALTMRLLVDSEFTPAGGIIGVGMDDVRWPRPVRPGDVLTLDIEVLQVRPSASKPNQGIAKMQVTTLNQHGEPVQILVANLVLPRR